ncbi:MAG: carbohydrate ABC transporter permease [bacterium]
MIGRISKGHFRGYNRSKLIFVYTMILPIMVWMFIFNILPIFYSFHLSLFKMGFLATGSMSFVGFDNYSKAFQDGLLWLTLKNTSYFMALVLLFHIPLAFLLALGLNSISRKYRSALLVCYFSPVAAGMIVGVLIFKYLYDPNVGLFNAIVTSLGFPKLYYVADPKTAMPSIFLINLWRYIGFDTVIFLAGLQGIPEQFYDSAKVDGAGPLRMLIHITVPLLGPVILFLTVTTFIGCVQFFAPIWMLASTGGPLRSVYMIMLYIYRTAFMEYRITYACAITYIVFMIILLLTLLQLRVGRRRWEY